MKRVSPPTFPDYDTCEADWSICHPTTPKLLDVIRKDIHSDIIKVADDGSIHHHHMLDYPNPSVLDIGSGNGAALHYLTAGTHYAIENDKELITQLPPSVNLIAGDFGDSNISQQKVDVVYCNPPLIDYEKWAVDVIKKANCKTIYLVLPKHCIDSPLIEEAMAERNLNPVVIHSDGFFHEIDTDSDISTGWIDIVKMTVPPETGLSTALEAIEHKEGEISFYFQSDRCEDLLTQQLQGCGEGMAYLECLSALCKVDMQEVEVVYQSIYNLSYYTRKEIGISDAQLDKRHEKRQLEVQQRYWGKVFEPILNHFAHKNDTADVLLQLTLSPFTASNVLQMSSHLLKQFNHLIDQQITEFFDKFVTEAHVIRYPSNHQEFDYQPWGNDTKQQEKETAYGPVALLPKILTVKAGGILASEFRPNRHNGLDINAANLINTCLAVGRCLGWTFGEEQDPLKGDGWVSGTPRIFNGMMYPREIEPEFLDFMTVRAFKNGTVKIQMNPKFLTALNLAVGRIRGWITDIKSAKEAFNFDTSKMTGNLELKPIKPRGAELSGVWDRGYYHTDASTISHLLNTHPE